MNIATQLLLQNKKGQSIDCPKVAGVGLECRAVVKRRVITEEVMSPEIAQRIITDQVPQSPLVAVWINTREVTTH
ncbi:MAG: hypothetical protein IJO90_00425 [Alistipes sp.]|nr:hypothetical protein [Alistipes sp.]